MAAFPHAGAWGSDNFIDPTTGLPIAAGTPVTVRLPGTATAAVLWVDRDRSATRSNPLTVAANGNVRFYTDDPGDFDVLCNGVTLRVTATPLPVDTLPGTGGGTGGTLDADAVAAEFQGTAPIGVVYSDASSGGTGKVTVALSRPLTKTDIDATVPEFNTDGSVTGGDGADPPLDTTLATHAYVNRGDDIVMTIRDLRYSANSVMIAVVDDTPVALPLTPSTVVGRGPTGNIVAVPWASLGGGGGSAGGAADVEFTDTTKGVIWLSPNGTRYRMTVSNSGTPIFTAL